MAHIPTSLLSEVNRLTNAGEKTKISSAQKVSTRPKPVNIEDTPTDDVKPQTSSKMRIADQAIRFVNRPTPDSNKTKVTKSIEKQSTVAAENAYQYKTTVSRVAHLVKRETNSNKELSFVYESPEDVKSEKKSVKDHRHLFPEKYDGCIKAEDLNIVTPISGIIDMTTEKIENALSSTTKENFPLLRPATRKEVVILHQTMQTLLHNLGVSETTDYPTEMHAFLSVIQDEQKIYDTVFSELIRQVTIHMVERGSVLSDLRARYATMFHRIPKHIRQLHVELVAQRKLNRRLSEELVCTSERLDRVMSELEAVRQHDTAVARVATEAQEKLVSVLTQSDASDVIQGEFHTLYRMQRVRLEEAVRLCEMEKRVWMDAATCLALRVGGVGGTNDLVLLQKLEHARLRNTNHLISIVEATNESEVSEIEKKIEEWRKRLVKVSGSVVDEDKIEIDTLGKFGRDMKMVLRNLETNEPRDLVETEHPLLHAFHIFDVKSLAESLMKWVEQISSVAVRFTSDRDLSFKEDIANIRKLSEIWIEACLKILRRNEKNTNGKEYVPLIECLSKVGVEVEDWLTKLDTRVTGEDGIASLVISLQNQLEDRYTTYGARDNSKPLPQSERSQLKENLTHWTEQTASVIEMLSDTCEKEQLKVPQRIENFMVQLTDQLNTDTNIRNE
ncbi:Axonemal dynein light chain domain-containing protein 1, partial [Nowakowskiella sp. JEL0078]